MPASANPAPADQPQPVPGAQAPAQSPNQPADPSLPATAAVAATRREQPVTGAATDPTSTPVNVTSIVGAQPAQAAAPTAEAPPAAAALPLADQVADGAALAARRIGQRVEVILQPEGLGTVSLRVSVERAGLGIHVAVDNPAAREMLQASWPQLQQALDQRGLSVQSMFLDLASGNPGGEAYQTFQQFSGQPFTGQQARGGSPAATRRDDPSIAAVAEESRPQTGAGATSRVDYRI
jgi:flagellar hook-length control protein FliK